MQYSEEIPSDLGDLRIPTSGVGQVLRMVASGSATSRASIARASGLARSTVSQHVDYLLGHKILDEVESGHSGRGRPPRKLRISPNAGTIIVIDIDTRVTQVAIADLAQHVVDRAAVIRPVAAGPQEILDAACEAAKDLIKAHGRRIQSVRQVVAGLPAPVDFAHGRPIRPPIMPGWDGYPVASHLSEAFQCPAIVDNDVNLVALGEATQDGRGTPLIAIKIADGIGAGLITATGKVHRGADGAAGDIGHIRTADHDDVLCQCGKSGCLEAVASYSAVLRDLDIPSSPSDDPLHASRLLAGRVYEGDPATLHRIRQAATEIGQVTAMLVHMYNPRTIVLVGPLTEMRDEVLSGVRAVVYDRALPLATRDLIITNSQLDGDSGLRGAIALATTSILSTGGIEQLLARHTETSSQTAQR